jgi:hypothetical protein
MVMLTPTGVQVDVAEFERLVRDGSPTALDNAATLYRGDFLVGLPRQAPDFEDWMMGERERLRELVIEALSRFVAHKMGDGHLEEALVLRSEAVDARCQHHLDRGRSLDGLEGLRQPIPAALPRQRLRFDQRPHGFLEEERVPAIDQDPLERFQRGLVPQERVQHIPCALGWKCVQPYLVVGRLAAPGVLVLRAIVHEQEHARRSKAVDQAIEQRLRLAVDPVQILEDQQQGLFPGFAKQ